MIEFIEVTCKNFLSVGNNPVTLKLNEGSVNCIVGTNGCGKSSIGLDTIAFALYGKAFRNINKPQLINSINKKGMLVELKFKVDNVSYMIRRGMKPNIFEIYRDGNLLNQDAASRDYQQILEQQILGMTFKTFRQIVVLGSSTFISFMELPAAARREVIENLLDIDIFSRMNILVKGKLNSINEELKTLEHKQELLNVEHTHQKRYINELRRNYDDRVEEIKKSIEASESRATELKTQYDKIYPATKSSHDKIQKTLKQLVQYESKISAKLSSIVKQLAFYEKNDTCPVCTQDISDTHKQGKKRELEEQQTSLQNALSELADKRSELSDELDSLASELAKCDKLIAEYSAEMRRVNKLRNDINNIPTADIIPEENKLLEIEVKLNEMRKQYNELKESKLYYTEISDMLKDTGIKTKVVKQYLPVINQLIKKYLNIMDFFVSFELDENFNEIIKSRYRDEFKYTSFSEGEKKRIDLALLMTWREVAKLKNSASTNLLIMDEIMDASLDQDGINGLVQILHSFDAKTNVFVISHRETLQEQRIFDNIYMMEKQGNFTKMSKING